ncbi:dihydroneopterin triphosphate diphosphatase [Chitinivorax sp. B]|uniref:dihydroneopterin triphosphate diphosphatase n=1 Tax=Chitinivorax sp. B TaxID=2502235 RepID=UPI0010F829F0|nr:dihydroneopterin triphosphate diphosphatase [Chitinivorax sp. B]
MPYKQPISTLIVIHTADARVLLLERADYEGAWQSVTGSREGDEQLIETAVREVGEETGFDATQFELTDWQYQNEYEIYERWRHRYQPGTTHNTEHVFGLLLPDTLTPRVAPREHVGFMWLPWDQAADKVFSWSNAAAIRQLPERLGLMV